MRWLTLRPATGNARIRATRKPGSRGSAIQRVFDLRGPRRAVLGRELGADVALNSHTAPMPGACDVIRDVPGILPDAAPRPHWRSRHNHTVGPACPAPAMPLLSVGNERDR